MNFEFIIFNLPEKFIFFIFCDVAIELHGWLIAAVVKKT